MNPTVIDTLRYADRLKAAGVEPGQAEAMSRALNAELTEGLATKSDLDAATAELKAADPYDRTPTGALSAADRYAASVRRATCSANVGAS